MGFFYKQNIDKFFSFFNSGSRNNPYSSPSTVFILNMFYGRNGPPGLLITLSN